MKASNVSNRPNKQAKGFTKHYERLEKLGRTRISNPKHPQYNEEKERIIVRLIVRGTLDELVVRMGLFSISKIIRVEHPIDKGYFKSVHVLSDFGKRILKNKKKSF